MFLYNRKAIKTVMNTNGLDDERGDFSMKSIARYIIHTHSGAQHTWKGIGANTVIRLGLNSLYEY